MTVKHGGNIQEISEVYQKGKERLIDFSANINPLGIPEGVERVIANSITQLIHYPDSRYQTLIRSIANFHEISEAFIYPSNGAAEAIFILNGRLRN